MREIKFFKEMKELTNFDMRDLTMSFQMLQFSKGDNVITYGEVGDLFYVLIKGSVSVNIPNPMIRHWKDKLQYKEDLIQWKQKFDVMIKAKINMQYLSSLNSETSILEKQRGLLNLEQLYAQKMDMLIK